MDGNVVSSLITSLLLHLLFIPGYLSATFTFTNNCRYTVWPGSLASAGQPPLSPTGFSLKKGESRQIATPRNWSGRLWGRTNCRQNPTDGKFTCTTGDCGTGEVECSGAGANPPATLAEFTLDTNGGMDYYDVSLVDGFNLPISLAPQQTIGGRRSANCTVAECAADINGACPADLRVADEGVAAAVACRSACDAFGADEYCCRGAYGGPGTCKPTSYSLFFKRSCPKAYSYAYDDGSSIITCSTAQGHVITFCPLTSGKKSDGGEKAKPADLTNYPMVFAGSSPNDGYSDAAPLGQPNFIPSLAGVALVSLWHTCSLYRFL